MKKAKVLHASPPNFMCEDKSMSVYQEVAEVVIDQDVVSDAQVNIILDFVYAMSQNVSQSWLKNIGVKALNDIKESRSTSTGDIVVIDDVKYRCEWIGWKKLDI
jgi:uncharacterized SAM-binding protein YcdF (DUF218 family)